MSEKKKQRERLLAETFGDDWATGPASKFAARAAAAARWRRRRQVALAGFGAVVVILGLVLAKPSSLPPPASRPAATPSPGYEIITDSELMAALGSRPVLILPEKDLGSRIVLLDR